MKPSINKHLFNTWALAHLLHPLVFFIYCAVIEGDQLYFGWNDPRSLLSFTCLGILVSIPSLLFSAVSLRIILMTVTRPAIAFIIWVFIVLISINAGAWFMLNMFMGFFNWSFLGIFIPGMIAAIMSIIIRRKQFVRMTYTVLFNRFSVQLYRIGESSKLTLFKIFNNLK